MISCLAALCCTMLGPLIGDTPPGPLELTSGEAVDLALAQNARLRVAAIEVVAASEAAEAADRPEPIRLSLNPATILRQLTGSISHVLGLSQERKYASRAARHELAALTAAREEFLLELQASTAATYWALRAADMRVDVLTRAWEDTTALRNAHRSLAEAGAISPASCIETDVALNRAAIDLGDARAAREQIEVQIRKLLGLAPTVRVLPTDELAPGLSSIEDAAVLRERAIDARPALRRVRELAEATDADVGVARAGRRPKVAVGLGTEELELFGVLSLDVPLIDLGSIRHTVRAAKASAEAAQAEVEVVRQEIEAEVDDALSRLRNEEARLVALEQQALPLAFRTAENAEAAHAEGQASRVAVLQARLEVHAVEVDVIDAKLDALLAQIGLARAISPALPNNEALEEEH